MTKRDYNQRPRIPEEAPEWFMILGTIFLGLFIIGGCAFAIKVLMMLSELIDKI